MEAVSQPEKDRMKEKTKYCRWAKVIHCSASFFKTFFPLFNQLCLLFIFHGPVKLKLRMKGAKKGRAPFLCCYYYHRRHYSKSRKNRYKTVKKKQSTTFNIAYLHFLYLYRYHYRLFLFHSIVISSNNKEK